MSIVLADRVRETTSTTGTGTVNLAGAATGYRTFIAGAGDGSEVYYAIVGQEGETCEGEWETGIGTVTDASPDTLSRTTILASSNAGAAVDFSAGTKDVFLTLPAKAPVALMEVVEPSNVATLDIDIGGCEAVKIIGWLKPATDNVILYIRLSNDGGVTFEEGAADYQFARIYGTDGNTSGAVGDKDIAFIQGAAAMGNAAGEFCAIELTLIGPATADVKTTAQYCISYTETDGSIATIYGSGFLNTAEINDAVRFLYSAGNIADGRLAVYRYPAP